MIIRLLILTLIALILATVLTGCVFIEPITGGFFTKHGNTIIRPLTAPFDKIFF